MGRWLAKLRSCVEDIEPTKPTEGSSVGSGGARQRSTGTLQADIGAVDRRGTGDGRWLKRLSSETAALEAPTKLSEASFVSSVGTQQKGDHGCRPVESSPEDEIVDRLGARPARHHEETIKRVMRIFNGELMHRWDLGQIVEEDRLLDFLIWNNRFSVDVDVSQDAEPVDLQGWTPAKLGDTISVILRVLSVCSTSNDAIAVIEGRRGFCKAFDELPFDLRKRAMRVAHGKERGEPRIPRGIEGGFPIVDPDIKRPGHYIAYRYCVDGLCGHGASDLEALDDLERREREWLSHYAAPRAQGAGSVGNGKKLNSTGINQEQLFDNGHPSG